MSELDQPRTVNIHEKIQEWQERATSSFSGTIDLLAESASTEVSAGYRGILRKTVDVSIAVNRDLYDENRSALTEMIELVVKRSFIAGYLTALEDSGVEGIALSVDQGAEAIK